MLQFRSSQLHPVLCKIRFLYRMADNIPTGFSVMMALVQHQVWISWTFFRFKHFQPEPRYALERVKSTFHFLACLQQCHVLRSHLQMQWLAGGILGMVCGDGTLKFPDELHSHLGGEPSSTCCA